MQSLAHWQKLADWLRTTLPCATSAQSELVKKYYRGYIPHVVVLDSFRKPLYNNSGEVEESVISGLLDNALH